MIYISGTKEFKLTNTAVALGKFDGLHRGHQVLIDHINHYKEKGMLSVVFTFDYHPNSLFGDKEQRLIYTFNERRIIAERMGVDVLIEYPFTKETASMDPAAFIKEVLIDKVGARFVVVGEDFRLKVWRRCSVIRRISAGKSAMIYRRDWMIMKRQKLKKSVQRLSEKPLPSEILKRPTACSVFRLL